MHFVKIDCPNCLDGKATISRGYVIHGYCGYRVKGPDAVDPFIAKVAGKKNNPNGPAECIDCEAETLVRTSDGYICLNCGSRWKLDELVSCEKCEKLLLFGEKTLCSDCYQVFIRKQEES